MAETTQQMWERISKSLPAGQADGIEQNAEEMGLEDRTPEFYAECVGQAVA